MIDKQTANAFVIEEYKGLLDRQLFVRKDIATFETLSLAATFAFYAWALKDGPTGQLYHGLVYIVPVAIALYAYARLKWRLESNRIVEIYTRQIEKEVFDIIGPLGGVEGVRGYENFYNDFQETRLFASIREPTYKVIIAVELLVFCLVNWEGGWQLWALLGS